MTADTNITLALLDAIWRAFDESKRPRLHTADLLSELLDMDEGRWREARHGQPITAYYLRDNLGDMLPANAEEIAPRRWREGSGNPQFGYDVLHLKDAFQRYLAKGLPGQVVGETQGLGRGAEPESRPGMESLSGTEQRAKRAKHIRHIRPSGAWPRKRGYLRRLWPVGYRSDARAGAGEYSTESLPR